MNNKLMTDAKLKGKTKKEDKFPKPILKWVGGKT